MSEIYCPICGRRRDLYVAWPQLDPRPEPDFRPHNLTFKSDPAPAPLPPLPMAYTPGGVSDVYQS